MRLIFPFRYKMAATIERLKLLETKALVKIGNRNVTAQSGCCRRQPAHRSYQGKDVIMLYAQNGWLKYKLGLKLEKTQIKLFVFGTQRIKTVLF